MLIRLLSLTSTRMSQPKTMKFFFLLICVPQMFQNKSSLVATLATLSNSCNLHNPRWPLDAILKNQLFKFIVISVVQYVFLWVFKHAESVSGVIFAFRCLATSNSKMAASRHFEKSAF